MAVTDVDKIKM